MRNFMTFRDFDSNPFSILNDVERDMRRALDLKPEENYGLKSLTSDFAPACDMKDSDSHLVLSFDIPGVNKKDMRIELKDGRLHISGERKNHFKQGDYTEKKYGRFERVISLPEGIEENKIEAHYENGVLALALPKAEKVQPKQIAIGESKKDGLWDRLLGGMTKDDSKEALKVETKDGKAA